jgi:hypothetical protein
MSAMSTLVGVFVSASTDSEAMIDGGSKKPSGDSPDLRRRSNMVCVPRQFVSRCRIMIELESCDVSLAAVSSYHADAYLCSPMCAELKIAWAGDTSG